MNPNGFVPAASITSHTSSPSRSHIRATSLTSPMLTLRKVFSRSFTISAARVLVERPRHVPAVGGHSPDDLRGVAGVVPGVPGVDPLRREGQEEVPPHPEPGG